MRKTKKAAMLLAFRQFSDRIAARYEEAYACLEQEDYFGALVILDNLTTSHAKTSLSLRSAMIRDGLIGGDQQ